MSGVKLVAAAGAGKTRLAYVSPLPPVPSGIADYSAELIPQLARHFELVLVTDQASVAPGFEAYERLDSASFLRRAESFDHVLYHFGNSPFHAHMPQLLRRIPGVVVLHDVYLGHLMAHIQESGRDPVALRRALWQSHGWPALACWRDQGLEAVLQQYPASGELLAHATGVIVHSEHARQLMQSWYEAAPVPILRAPLPQASPTRAADRQAARRRLGVPDDVFLVCSFGYAGPGKMAEELVQAWHEAGLAEQSLAWLRLVGGHQFGEGSPSAQSLSAALEPCIRTTLTGYVDAQAYQDHLAAADLAVQLRTASRGETSRAVLEVIAHGIPLMLNAHGSSAEIPAQWAAVLPDPLDPSVLAQTLRRAWEQPGPWRERAELAAQALPAQHGPEVVAAEYTRLLQQLAARTPSVVARCWQDLQQQVAQQGRLEWAAAHRAAARSLAAQPGMARRLRPALETVALPPRRPGALLRLARDQRQLRVAVITAGSLEAPQCAEDRRIAAMVEAYRAAAYEVEVHGWHAERQAMFTSLSVVTWQVVHLAAPLPAEDWHELQRRVAPGTVYVLHLPRNLGAAFEDSYSLLAAHADLLICASEKQAELWRSRTRARVLCVPDGVDPLTADLAELQQERQAQLSQGRFAMLAAGDQVPAVQAFEHLVLGSSLAYLPMDARLIIIGELGNVLRRHPRFMRWAGINLARGMTVGRVGGLTYQAARQHAWVKVVLPNRDYAAGPPSLRLREALQDPGWVLTCSAALAGAEWVRRHPRVWVEDDADRFRLKLASLLQGPTAPPVQQPLSPGWEVLTAVVSTEVAQLAEWKRAQWVERR